MAGVKANSAKYQLVGDPRAVLRAERTRERTFEPCSAPPFTAPPRPLSSLLQKKLKTRRSCKRTRVSNTTYM